MPAGKRPQSSAMLYTLIIFVGLFIVTTTVAVILYVKFEEQRTIADDSQRKLKEIATDTELRQIGTIVGTIPRGKSGLGTMVDYLDKTVYLIIGGLPEDTSAEVKVDTANRKTKDALLLTAEHIDVETIDPNITGLIQIIERLKTKLDNTTNAALAMQKQLNDLQNQFDDAMAANFEKEQKLLVEKEEYKQQLNERKQDYDELEALMRQTTDEQVQTLGDDLKEQEAKSEKLYDDLLKTRAELIMAKDRMQLAIKRLQEIKPQPDIEVAAFKPDGEIILIDDQVETPIVLVNIGSDDRVYRGLTFSVYDKNVPIPKDGRGKAEIEVFDVEKNISAARITLSEKRRPIVLGDIIANLIWDSEKTNLFVVAGEFDLDSDGDIDPDAVDKIKELVRKWGGKVADTVSIETDFLVLGTPPRVRPKPTFEELEVYPLAMEKYNVSLQKLAHYNEVRSIAEALSIPVFNAERFLYLVGYKAQAVRAGAF